jgi:hypothetical protein
VPSLRQAGAIRSGDGQRQGKVIWHDQTGDLNSHRSNAIVGFRDWLLPSRDIGGMAMKVSSRFFVAGLAVAFLSIAPANAEKKNGGCSDTTWRSLSSPELCPTIKAASYEECAANYRKLGWRGNEREWCEAAGQAKPAKPAAR